VIFSLAPSTVIHIRCADGLALHLEDIVYRITTARELSIHEIGKGADVVYPFQNMLVVSVDEPQRLLSHVVDSFSIIIKCKPYSPEQIFAILKQRMKLVNWNMDENIIAMLAKLNDISLALKTVELAYRISRAESEEMITEKHVKEALRFIRANQLELQH